MKKIFNLQIICMAMLIAACHNDRIKFEPDDRRPVQSIQIADGDEAALLQQELGLDIKMIEGNNLFYFVKNDGQEKKLRDIGYATKTENLRQINFKVVRLSLKDKAPDKTKSEELKRYHIQIINKEEKYWAVRGSLEALTKIQELGYKVTIETNEPRPRQVEITVPLSSDIQKVNELGVDIYSSTNNSTKSDKQRKFIISGGAFDYQIEQMQALGYIVILK